MSICDISSKIYSTIINSRLQEWVDENNLTGEFQAGFKRDYSTIDHIYTLFAIIQKQFTLNRKIYVAFIDFEKAFDSINRSIMWPILLKNGIKGKLYQCVMSMYESVKARVRCGGSLTECINCTTGVKQGDVCSPVLFSLFINEVTKEVVDNGRHGASFINDALQLFILLLADDIALISETIIGLQSQLNSLHRSASALQLNINMSKSNIIVFRKGGYLARREQWTYNGVLMPVVNVYKYLGIYFSTRLSFTFACKDLASRGKKALVSIMHNLTKLNSYSLKLLLKLFDSQVQPILLYGAEVWGFDNAAIFCEKVYLFALKKFLGVSLKTLNDLVYGETNRYSLQIISVVKCIRYWLRLTRMDQFRLPRKAYNTLYTLDERGKLTWVTNVRNRLFEYGFAEVWFNQGVENQALFLRLFRERLVDCQWLRWHEHIENSDRFEMYRFINPVHQTPLYLNMKMNRNIKRVVTKFRFGISDIKKHSLYYRSVDRRELLCPLCSNDVEDETHFVLVCPELSKFRERYIPNKFWRQPCLSRLFILVSAGQEGIAKQLAMYLYRAFKLRDTLLN